MRKDNLENLMHTGDIEGKQQAAYLMSFLMDGGAWARRGGKANIA